MFYLSQIINRPIRDRHGAEMARLLDVVVRLPQDEEICPQLHGLVARSASDGVGFFLPVLRVGTLGPNGATLASPNVTLEKFERREGELLLSKDVWDRRVIDPRTKQARRVNDVALGLPGELAHPQQTPPDGYPATELEALGVDISIAGIARRLGLHSLSGALSRRPGASELLPWEQIDLLTGRSAARHENLAQMHPVEIAALTAHVSNPEAAAMLAGLDDEIAADVLEELPAERQLDIVEYLSDDRAADIIEEMAPDDASDLLGDLSEERAASLLEQMEPESATTAQALLAYPDNTAGGMMTTSFLRIDDSMTVAQATESLRQEVEKPDLLAHLYVVGAGAADQLRGAVTLRDLLLAAPAMPVGELLYELPAHVAPTTEDREVARKMAEYNLVDIPVIDDDGRLLGIVTVDDALDVLLPSGWQRRMPRIFG